MKRTLLLIGLALASFTTFAQTTTFGVKAGLNLSKITYSATGGSISSQNLAGFHVGGVVDFGFENFSIQPGVLFSTKGGKSNVNVSEDGFTLTDNSKVTLNYIEVPVNFIYKIAAGQGHLLLGAGPYLGYGVSGKSTDDYNENGEQSHSSESVKFGSGEEEIKNPDFGLNFLIGYQLKQGLFINAGYGLGLSNLSNGGEEGSTKNQVVSVSLGYFFK